MIIDALSILENKAYSTQQAVGKEDSKLFSAFRGLGPAGGWLDRR